MIKETPDDIRPNMVEFDFYLEYSNRYNNVFQKYELILE